ncbi:MAG: RHS repeat-associated core domain-containing protein [Desulfobaccales bacterium]
MPGDDDCSDRGDPCSGCGSPVWSVDKTNMNLYVKDIPLWHRPPVGPLVEIALNYNSLIPPASTEPFGNKWQFNYNSYLLVQTGTNGEMVTVYMPDGRRDIFTPLKDANGNQIGYTAPYGVHNRLTKTGSGSYELRFPDDTVYAYNIAGGANKIFLAEIRDPHYPNDSTLKLSFTYTNGNLTNITDAMNRVTTLTYNASGLVTAAIDPFGRQALFEYDGNRNLTKITDMGSYASSLTYEPVHNFINGIANARGSWQFYTEPADYKTQNPDGSAISAYPAPGAAMGNNYRITVTSPLGKKEEYYYCDSSNYSWHVMPGNYVDYVDLNQSNYTAPKTLYHLAIVSANSQDSSMITQIDFPGGGSRTYDYNTSGDLSSYQYDGKTWQYTYNPLGWPTSKTEPNGTVTSMTYDPNNIDLLSVKISNGRKTLGTETRTCNNTHDVLSLTDRLGNTSNFTYNIYGQVTAVTDALGVINNYLYDGLNHLTSIARAGQTLHQYTYDALDRISSHTDPTGLTLIYTYNNLDQVAGINYPDGKSKSYQYSTCCPFIVDSVTERSGQTTFYSYDKMNHLLSIADPAGRVTGFGYDANGNRTSITDPKGNSTGFSYDLNNRLIKKTYANGTFEAFTYAGVSELVATRTNARGVTTNYSYTELEKLAGYYDSPNSPRKTGTSYTYDVFGRLTRVSGSAGNLNFAYDNNSRLLSVDWPWTKSRVDYEYDALGRRLSITRGKGNRVVYSYDFLNRLTNLIVDSQFFTYGYSGASPLVQYVARLNAEVNIYQYDILNRLTQMSTTAAGVVVGKYTYTYNAQDLRDRETSLDHNPAYFDPELVNYAYNNVNALTQMNDKPLAYDASGNLTQGYTPEGYPFTAGYDSDNHLTSLSYTDSTGVVNQTVYSYLGHLLLKKQNYQDGNLINETRYVYDGFKLMQERDHRNNVENEYTWGPGLPGGIGGLMDLYQGAVHFSYMYDGKGNVTGLLDPNGNVAASYQYDPFGIPRGPANTLSQPFQFSTKQYDDKTGLSYYGYRFYVPSPGRWLTRDPLGEAGGINLYGFVGNNPMNFMDPMGLEVVPVMTRPGGFGGTPIYYNTDTGQYYPPGYNYDPLKGLPEAMVKDFADTMATIDNYADNPATYVTDRIPPGEKTGHPTIDKWLCIFQGVKGCRDNVKKCLR